MSRLPPCWILPAVLAVAIGCEPAGREAPDATPGPAPPPVRVQRVTVEPRSPVTRAIAPVRAERRATLGPGAAGHVVEAPLRRGARVEEGDVVLRLGGPKATVAVSQARARVSQARAALRQARRAREQAEKLAEQNASSPNAVQTARDRELEAEAGLAEAEAGLEAARVGQSETVLRAPFAGVIADFRVNEGEYVRPGMAVAVLVDPASLEAELLLDPVEAADARVGGRVTVTSEAHPDAVFEGELTFVAEVLDPRTRRLPVRASVDDPEGLLRPGTVAAFEVEVGAPRPAAVLPEHAVLRRMGQTKVFVLVDGVAQAREVRLGLVRDGEAEVLEGLEAGERVVVAGVERVIAGEPVRVVGGGGATGRGGMDGDGEGS